MFNRRCGSLPTSVPRRATHFRLVCGAFALVACLLAVDASTYAQNTSGSISGVVQDSQGAVIPVVTVSALNQNENNAVIENVTTNNSGVFAFNSLQASTYTVRVAAKGLKRYQQKDIVLNAENGCGHRYDQRGGECHGA